MKILIWGLLLLNLTTIKQCEQKDCCGPTPSPTLNWTGKWVLVNPKTAYSFTLIIEPKIGEGAPVPNEFRLSGVSSVNQYGAEANGRPDGSVIISAVGGTKRGGSPEAMTAETNYYNSLQKVTKAELVGGNLHLRSSDTNWSLLVYNKQ